MTTTLYLIRHGETDWNVTGRWQGYADVPLNAVGRTQAQLVARRLSNDGVMFDAIYSSDLARAYQTAWEIGSAVKVPVQLLPPLREIDLGLWSGLTRAEIQAQFPAEYARLEQGEDIQRGGGESTAMLYRRVVAAVEAIVAQHPGHTLALVTHGGPVRMLLRRANNQDPTSQTSFAHIGNTSLSIVHCNSSDWTAVTVNDMAHLADQPQAPDLMSAPPDDAEPPQEWTP